MLPSSKTGLWPQVSHRSAIQSSKQLDRRMVPAPSQIVCDYSQLASAGGSLGRTFNVEIGFSKKFRDPTLGSEPAVMSSPLTSRVGASRETEAHGSSLISSAPRQRYFIAACHLLARCGGRFYLGSETYTVPGFSCTATPIAVSARRSRSPVHAPLSDIG